MDTLSAVLGDRGDRVANGGVAAGNPFQRSWLIKPTTIISMLLSLIFISMSGCFILYGVIDRKPPMEIISAMVTSADPVSGILEVSIVAKRNRYCHGQRYGFIHDKYSFGLPPAEIPPEGFRGPIPSDGIVHWTIPVDVKDYFWKDPDGFVYRAEWRFRCNPLQGSLFPEVVVASPDVVVATAQR